MSKRIPIVSIVLVTCLLSACHKNPLKTNSEEDSTRFLINASIAATKILNLGLNEISSQRAYLNCMEGKAREIDCPTFYVAMTKLAQDKRFESFKGITVGDLSDKETFNVLRKGYEQRFFINNLEN